MAVEIRDLLEAGVHFGHQTRRWNPKMRRYIFMRRNGIHIIDLNKTKRSLDEARQLIHNVVRSGKSVLVVGTKRQAQDPIARESDRSGMFYVTERWLGGMLTNFKTVRSSIGRLIDIERMADDGTLDKLTKKEATGIEKERQRLQKVFSGIKEMQALPGLMVVVDTRKEAIAVREANRLKIPIVGIVDTNCDPDLVDLPVPGNDDAIRAIELYASFAADAVLEAKSLASEGRETAAAPAAPAQTPAAPEASPPPAVAPEPAAGAETPAPTPPEPEAQVQPAGSSTSES